MSKIHCFTSASFSYLDRVRVLAETVRRYQPDWTFSLCLSDIEPPGFTFNPAHEPLDHVVRASELDIPDFTRWAFDHDVIEMCTAVKGPMLCRLLDRGAQKVVYLDPDIALFARLDELEAILDHHDVALTPHQLEPDDHRGAIVDNEIGSLKYGIYNLGFLAVANTAEGRRFARWWADRLLAFCFDDLPAGLFTDQRWCDHVPVFFPTTFTVRDPGYNVASWNLSRRPISIDDDGAIRAANSILRFFHFTKINSVGETMLARYAGNSIVPFEMMNWYRKRLLAHRVAGLPDGWWGYASYTDGTPIPRAHRVAYRTRADLRQRFPNPFAGDAKSLKAALEAERPATPDAPPPQGP